MGQIYAQQSIEKFINDLNSTKPMPGGGSAAAVCGAMAAALAGMAAHMTSGKKRYADVEDQMQKIITETERLQQEMLHMAQEDAEMYLLVLQAFKLPKMTKEEIEIRKNAIANASEIAVQASLRVVSACIEILELALEVVIDGSQILVTDGAASALMSRACQQAASYNVRINLGGVTDNKFKENAETKLKQQLAIGKQLEETVLEEVEKRL